MGWGGVGWGGGGGGARTIIEGVASTGWVSDARVETTALKPAAVRAHRASPAVLICRALAVPLGAVMMAALAMLTRDWSSWVHQALREMPQTD